MPAVATRHPLTNPMFAAGNRFTTMPTSTGLLDAEQWQDQDTFSRVPLLATMKYGSGTGGDSTTGQYLWMVWPDVTPYLSPSETVVSPAEMLSFVRNTFGLNVKQAAGVFNVERPTIYLWANQQDFDRVRPQKRIRMKALYRLAQDCNARGRLPNNALEAVLENSPSLLELLSAAELDVPAILSCHAKLEAMTGKLEEQQGEHALALANAFAQGIASLGAKQTD
jgi:hypothetical protein